MLKKELLDVLCCPKCKGDVNYKQDKIICRKCKIFYPVKNDIPVMLIEEAEEYTEQ
ncbi:MAG: Trm112 family protein [bacterium]